MSHAAGWAEPGLIIGQPRVQMVAGFTYFYVEQNHPEEGQAEISLDATIAHVRECYRRTVADDNPPLMVMFFDVPGQPGMNDIEVGFVVDQHVCTGDDLKVRYVPATLCASMLTWGDVNSQAKSYQPLVDFMKEQGLKPVVGWREYYLYWEGETSQNNIIWIQHVAEEA